MRKELKRFGRVDEQRLFDKLAGDEGMITKGSLRAFLLRMSYIPNDNLLLAIIRRIDLDCDAKLCFSEFYEALQPGVEVRTSSSDNRRRPQSSSSAQTYGRGP